jgi:hypothetical protein
VLSIALVGCATGHQVKGYVTGTSEADRTVTIDGQVIHVPRNISMNEGGTPIALQDIAIGDKVDARVNDNTNNPPDANAITVIAIGNGKEPRK